MASEVASTARGGLLEASDASEEIGFILVKFISIGGAVDEVVSLPGVIVLIIVAFVERGVVLGAFGSMGGAVSGLVS